ncbi:MAG: AAA family ATPase [Candidatus Syntrophoarchaeum sp.]|nr:AAA family ATPase [Candidatus Syntrophoarchaeum sp.]
MITKLRITNFRGIKEGEIELAPLTILLGGNNSGKTTILEALFLAPNPFRTVPYVIGDSNTAAEVIHSMHETLSSEGYAFLLYNYTANQVELGCKVDGDDYVLLFTKNAPYIFASTNKQKTGELYPVTIDGEKVETWRIGNMDLSERHISMEVNVEELPIDNTLLISSKLVKMGYEYLERNWASIINLGICKKVAEDVSGLVYDNYRDITIEPFLGGKLAIYGFLEDGRRIRLGDLGEGVQSYIIARILYELEKPKVLLWDDIETHLNPRMLLSIAEWFFDIVENGNQVVFTTHSLEAARTIAGLNEEKTVIYLTSLEKSNLKAEGLMLKDMEEYLDAGIDVRVAEPFLL